MCRCSRRASSDQQGGARRLCTRPMAANTPPTAGSCDAMSKADRGDQPAPQAAYERALQLDANGGGAAACVHAALPATQVRDRTLDGEEGWRLGCDDPRTPQRGNDLTLLRQVSSAGDCEPARER